MRVATGRGLILLAFAATARAAGPSLPLRLSPAEATVALQAIEKDRVDTQEWLRTDPSSYLATVDRRDFLGKAMLTVGRAPDNDLRINDPDVQPHHLRVRVVGDQFQIEAIDAAARFTIKADGKDTTTRGATVPPSAVHVGRFMVRLSHANFPGLVVFDPRSPRFKDYKGLKYFEPDLSYRYELPLTPNPRKDITLVLSTRGNQRRAVRVGWFEFIVNGTPCRLEALRLLEPGVGDDLGIFFRDATSGSPTYGLGRYVDVKKQPNGHYLLDFNLAYNPACAYSEHYNCPIPPKANVLTVAIRAGEMDSHYY